MSAAGTRAFGDATAAATAGPFACCTSGVGTFVAAEDGEGDGDGWYGEVDGTAGDSDADALGDVLREAEALGEVLGDVLGEVLGEVLGDVLGWAAVVCSVAAVAYAGAVRATNPTTARAALPTATR
ncbi:hypothetical protein [Nocardioides sp. Iso805N]|uniref:hypothetical protein n=1 Tax=Nocardioides sp. Iso805N TaxID=1283287 RepID=UPI0012FA4E0B|nr:hypothetical protein [Nocardioides sp. Iso805N]